MTFIKRQGDDHVLCAGFGRWSSRCWLPCPRWALTNTNNGQIQIQTIAIPIKYKCKTPGNLYNLNVTNTSWYNRYKNTRIYHDHAPCQRLYFVTIPGWQIQDQCSKNTKQAIGIEPRISVTRPHKRWSDHLFFETYIVATDSACLLPEYKYYKENLMPNQSC